MPYAQTPVADKAKNPCCGGETEAPGPVDNCCTLVCFERPNYFCGHLLTDADLRLEQHYLREKLKLYHRTLHGPGVVCGMRLTCDCHCPERVVIGEGFGIDDCGHDLVICAPEYYDVIKVLRQRGELIEAPKADPCKAPEAPSECKVTQCFYIVVCYDEEETEFTTPFSPGCRPQLSECEPTRIREKVRYDVVSKLPKYTNILDEMIDRLECCWRVLKKGAIPAALAKHQRIIRNCLQRADVHNHTDNCSAFQEVRGLFRLYVERHPDRYNCALQDELTALIFPPDMVDTTDERTPEAKRAEHRHHQTPNPNYAEQVKAVFLTFFGLLLRYIRSCEFGTFIAPCPQTCEPSCLVLGTVEIESGKIVRVCNCPRSYHIPFANFLPAIASAFYGSAACAPEEEGHVCCREFDATDGDIEEFLDPAKRDEEPKSAAGLRALKALLVALQHGFDFTAPGELPVEPILRFARAGANVRDWQTDLGRHETDLKDLQERFAKTAAEIEELGRKLKAAEGVMAGLRQPAESTPQSPAPETPGAAAPPAAGPG